MTLLSSLKFIVQHPINKKRKLDSVKNFISWQIASRLIPFPIIYQFTEKSKLIVKKGMAGATGNFYCGLHEFNDMGFLLHFLRPDDFFMDIGANIGSYTILASAHIGTQTVAIEPVPSTFEHLENNIKINNIHEKVTAMNIALGNKKGHIHFSSKKDTTNRVLTKPEKDSISVEINNLDDVVEGKDIPSLIKIDVEGFESEVLRGGESTFKDKKLKAVIIELNGSGNRYGYKDEDIHSFLKEIGFQSVAYDPIKRELKEINDFGDGNTIYVRDYKYIKERVKTSQEVKINNVAF